MNKTITKPLLISLGSLIFALGFQYLCNPRDFIDLYDFGFWLPVTLAFAGYWAILGIIIIWIIDGYKLNTNTGNTKLIISLPSIAVALGVQYLLEPRDFLDFDDGDFWIPVILAFAGYWAIIRIIIWVIDGYKLNIKTGEAKLVIALTSIAIALGVQYLIDPYYFLNFDETYFWLLVTLTFAGYWAIVRIIIWILDGYKLNTDKGNIKLTISLASIVIACVPQLIELELDRWSFGILIFAEYWILIAIITQIINNKHKSSTGKEDIKLVFLILALIPLSLMMLFLLVH